MQNKTRLFILVTTLMLQGCVNLGVGDSKTTSYFVLSSLQDTQAFKSSRPGLTVGVGPLEMAPYLDRNTLVTKSSTNELTFSEFKRWAEPLDEGILRVVTENLSILLGTHKVHAFPWRHHGDMTYRLKLDIQRFEVTANQQALVSARWSLHHAKLGMMHSGHFTHQANASKEPQAELSHGLTLLSHDVSKALLSTL